MTLVDTNPDYFTDVNALTLTGVTHVDNTYYANMAGEKAKEEEIIEEEFENGPIDQEEEEVDPGV
jgi:hypothetical protein